MSLDAAPFRGRPEAHRRRAGYGRIQALNGIDLEVRRGQIVTLLGANGAGKTTTLKTISGLVRATAGTIVLEGEDITQRRASDIARLGVVHVPEGRHILRGLSVRENLELGAFTVRDASVRQRAHGRGLPPLSDPRPAQASGRLAPLGRRAADARHRAAR